MLWLGLFTLFLIPAGIRILAAAGLEPTPWRWNVDLPLAVVLSVGAALCSASVAGNSLRGGPFTASDFSEYCEIVDALLSDRIPLSSQRSLLTASLYGPMVDRFGVIDGFGVTAIGSVVVIGMALYLWGHAVGGRIPALLSPLFFVACTPLVLLTRTLSFYPPLVAATALASATTAMAVRTRSTFWVVIASVCVAAAPLFDLRNVLWVACCLPLLAWAAGPRKSVVLVLALIGSWTLGQWTYQVSPTSSLEGQTQMFVNDLRYRAGMKPHFESCNDHPFNWGWADLRYLPDTIRCVRTLQADSPTLEQLVAREPQRYAELEPGWRNTIGIAFLVWLLGYGGMRRVLALVVPSLPFLVTGTSADLDPSTRHVAAAIVPMPLVLAAAWGVLVEAEGRGFYGRLFGWLDARRLRGLEGNGLQIGVPLLLVAGAVNLMIGVPDSSMSPTYGVRKIERADTEWATMTDGSHRGRPIEKFCAARIEADEARGIPPFGWLGARWWPSGKVLRDPAPAVNSPAGR